MEFRLSHPEGVEKTLEIVEKCISGLNNKQVGLVEEKFDEVVC